ncbi:hypothetical protein Premu_0941 [Hallella multisaccharivorax DSM 17128]|uniref:Uncharacterized protein n=1 Tax=Hallella multisaccharivorax DSM 17128 TaxID=688246 RepID=F8N7N8_9BACT|nr:hypothetical protein Premu_0941 [Hallella multisaccharivorax DSM 17128]
MKKQKEVEVLSAVVTSLNNRVQYAYKRTFTKLMFFL